MRLLFLSLIVLSLCCLACSRLYISPIKKHRLVDLKKLCPDIVFDMRYSTTDNFVKRKIYQFDTCYLHEDAANRLALVQQELVKMGFGLKIWDCHRPMRAQELFWSILPDERYVSNPQKGSRHTKGTAVDLTLVDASGTELEMPSLFDDFSEKAHRSFEGASIEAIKNRQLLEDLMKKHGFIGLPTEWWHFDLEGWRSYPDVKEEIGPA